MGHDIVALSSVDFVVTLQRGTEWAATGKVTQKVPVQLSYRDTVSYRADLAALDPDYPNGLDNLDLPVRDADVRHDASTTLGRLFSELVDGTAAASAPTSSTRETRACWNRVEKLSAADASRSTNDGATVAAPCSTCATACR